MKLSTAQLNYSHRVMRMQPEHINQAILDHKEAINQDPSQAHIFQPYLEILENERNYRNSWK